MPALSGGAAWAGSAQRGFQRAAGVGACRHRGRWRGLYHRQAHTRRLPRDAGAERRGRAAPRRHLLRACREGPGAARPGARRRARGGRGRGWRGDLGRVERAGGGDGRGGQRRGRGRGWVEGPGEEGAGAGEGGAGSQAAATMLLR